MHYPSTMRVKYRERPYPDCWVWAALMDDGQIYCVSSNYETVSIRQDFGTPQWTRKSSRHEYLCDKDRSLPHLHLLEYNSLRELFRLYRWDTVTKKMIDYSIESPVWDAKEVADNRNAYDTFSMIFPYLIVGSTQRFLHARWFVFRYDDKRKTFVLLTTYTHHDMYGTMMMDERHLYIYQLDEPSVLVGHLYVYKLDTIPTTLCHSDWKNMIPFYERTHNFARDDKPFDIEDIARYISYEKAWVETEENFTFLYFMNFGPTPFVVRYLLD